MVTLFVITTLSVIGLPMLNGFVGEFLVFSGSMQWSLAHGGSFFWTALSTSGVILTAAYMLWMIQRVFYGGFGLKSERVAGWDLDAREHVALWPLVAVFLAMGVASPYWTRAIDTFGIKNSFTPFEQILTPAEAEMLKHGHSVATFRVYDADGFPQPGNQPSGFVDPALAAQALGQPAPQTNKGAHY